MNQVRHKVSVIVPIYNVEKYIEQSITSICRQDFKDYQIVLVNDGTKDKSVEIAEKVLKKENADYIIHTQKNTGLPSARNSGIRESDGDYVVFVDSDDIISCDFLSSLYTACVNNNCKAAFTEYEVTHMKNRNGFNNSDNGSIVLNRDKLLYNNMLRRIKIHLCAMMIERSFLEQHNLWFDETLRYGEEVDFTWRMYPLLDKVVYIKSPKYKYLVRENSLMTNQNLQRVEYLLDVMHKDINIWFDKEKEDSKKYKWVEQKIYFEKIHAFAQQSQYRTFKTLLERTQYKERMKELADFPDIKVRILAKCLIIFPFSFWMLFQIHKL